MRFQKIGLVFAAVKDVQIKQEVDLKSAVSMELVRFKDVKIMPSKEEYV